MAATTAPTLAAKVAALKQAEAYRAYDEFAGDVIAIETHMSWVFLTGTHAFKLKKPVVAEYIDFRSLENRFLFCTEEFRLNRRLAADTYIGVVELRQRADGRLTLDGDEGEIVDYLVQMKQLPTQRMLDRVLTQGEVSRESLRELMDVLCNFYREADKISLDPFDYRTRFATAVGRDREDLAKPVYDLPWALVDRIVSAQLRFIDTSRELPRRAENGHIVDAHGDLRPEHVYLGPPLQIIDCLEFQSVLRMLDPADEVGFLALECERLGAPRVGTNLLRYYRVLMPDRITVELMHFYQSHRACVRAKLAIRHLDDPRITNREHWRQRALRYLQLAEAHVSGFVMD